LIGKSNKSPKDSMNQYEVFSKGILLLFAPLIASTALATSPSQAATFASSEGVLNLTKFSQSPLNVGTFADGNPSSIGNDNIVLTLAKANAEFIVAPPAASSSSLSQAFGNGINTYLGLAESEAKVIGNFVVDAGKPFSFDFSTTLDLKTSVDNPSLPEKAVAFGEIFLALLDTTNQNVLDFFNLEGNISSLDDNDFIAFQKSENVTLIDPVTKSSFGGGQEFAQANVQGSLQRNFANQTNLTLIEVKKNKVRVEVPEPSISLALLFSCGIIGIALKGSKRKAITPTKS
jgi:hypothetical protein